MKRLIYSIVRFYHSLPTKSKVAHRKFLIWRYKYLNNRQFVLLLSILIGFSSGLVAVALKNSVHFIQSLLEPNKLNSYENYLYLIYPAIGIIITVLVVRYFVKRAIGHGIPSTLYAISKKNSNIPFSKTYSSLITSMITVGFGGSVGLEGPTVGASSAIGSNYARLGRMNYKTTTLLLGCGAASAMSGIFMLPLLLLFSH